MFNDDQVNELEKALFTAHSCDVPLLVGKWLPVLFTELRLTRAALDSKAMDFFSGGISDLPQRTVSDSVTDPESDDRGLQASDEHQRRPEEVEPVAEAIGVDGAAPVRTGTAKGRKASRRPKPRGNRASAGSYEGLVVNRDGGVEVGGEADDPDPVPGSGPSVVEAPAELTATSRACNGCGVTRGPAGPCEWCGSPDTLEGQLPLPMEATHG